MASVWRDLTGAAGRVSRGKFLAAGVAMFVLKFAIDHTVAAGFGFDWSLLDYLTPWTSISQLALEPVDRTFYATMLLVALPFVWIGLVLTRQRLRDAGMSAWQAFLFFVPLLNLLFFAALAVIPRARRNDETDEIPFASVAPAAHAPPLDYGRDDVRRRLLARWFPV